MPRPIPVDGPTTSVIKVLPCILRIFGSLSSCSLDHLDLVEFALPILFSSHPVYRSSMRFKISNNRSATDAGFEPALSGPVAGDTLDSANTVGC